MDWQQLDDTFIISTYRRLPIAIQSGEGNYLTDTRGKRYLDLFTGLAVNVLGHSHPAVVRALQEQGTKFLHISNYFLNPPAIQLAKRLVEHSIPGKVFFTNSGAEATEAAIKLIHRWTVRRGEGRAGIVVLTGSFHGRTLGAIRLTRQPHVYQDFPQPSFPVHEVAAEDLEAMGKVIREQRPAAVLMEPVLGSGGVIPLSDRFLQETARLCHETGTLFCMDEIQTGMGRTGTLFAYQQAAVRPDLILFAKGVGGGLPLGGLIAGEKLAGLFGPGDHGTTFAPSPLAAALGNAVLDVILDAAFMEQARNAARYLRERLAALSGQFAGAVGEIRGKGMMLGVQLKLAASEVSRLQRLLLDDGFLVDVTQQTIVRLLPPLTLTHPEIDRFIDAFGRALTALGAQQEVRP